MDFEAITRTLLKDIPPWEVQPFYALAAGGPASHKMLLATLLRAQNHKGFIVIDDDKLGSFFLKDGTNGYPHHEKDANHIHDYYHLVETIVKEAGKRGISVILEDHGDYPQIYKQHADELGKLGYESFLLATTITPENFDAKLDYLVKNDGLPDFRGWGKAYHKRIGERFDALLPIFDRGMLIETQPSYISPDGASHAYGVMRFDNSKGLKVEVLDEKRYETFRSWQEYEIPDRYQDYFRPANTAMESRLSAGRYAEGIARSGTHRERTPEENSTLMRLVQSAAENKNGRHL